MSSAAQAALATRPDFDAIAEWIKADASVLDLGCGDGGLLRHLQRVRKARGYGIEISDENVISCVQNGVNVIQSNLEAGLSGFDADSFDCVILSQTLQTMRRAEHILLEMLRVGREAIVTFPNFGYWRHRVRLTTGRMPVADGAPTQWYDTPNVRPFTIRDFEQFCAARGIRVLERIVMHRGRKVGFLRRLRGSLAVYRIEKSVRS